MHPAGHAATRLSEQHIKRKWRPVIEWAGSLSIVFGAGEEVIGSCRSLNPQALEENRGTTFFGADANCGEASFTRNVMKPFYQP
jgi:hypothetical protein